MYGVILAGGSGTRFWPTSREQSPKQLQKIVGTRTMLQNTVQRLLPLISIENLYLGTNHQQVIETLRQLESYEFISDHLIAEPCNRNTALAIGLIAKLIIDKDADAVMAVFPADHVVANPENFIKTLQKAEVLAEKGYLVTLGIPPTRPETGFGYLQQGAEIEDGAYKVERFVEKPDRPKAEQYLQHGKYFWNCGVFVWKASTILEELHKYAENIYSQLEAIAGCIQNAKAKPAYLELNEAGRDLFSSLPSLSIDYAVMEHSSKVALIPADIGWNDVGAWNSLDDVSEKDSKGNIISGNVLVQDCNNSIVQAQNRLIAVLGLKDTIVVDSPDALLVCAKERSQDVKKLVESLNENGHLEAKQSSTVNKPWGSYTVLDSGPTYLLKRIEVLPGEALSLQSHQHRSEHWTVVSGSAEVMRNKETFHLKNNDSITIPKNTKHRLGNPGLELLTIIEIQFGHLLDEADISRYEDRYGRC
ncbi:MAG: mannose-1-phosphate guanylyltransferase/mannose-6-phosphate isomerase [Nitrospinae bacterium]|nr:mannose-1-phosphate guanylyltransferase/mannose-6-phosphate isomerase [Nitrospinota bacterium]MBL7020493.1 mannose-1-phosphate guanylyltransferase/mannose-6-phosphate isomerase [Nitrospinaceae bacterium]